MKRPAPIEGLVIRYDYLWKDEYQRGRLEGQKERPCAIVVAVPASEGTVQMVIVVPITHSEPAADITAIELPAKVKRHLGLDKERSWIITSEVNRVRWDDPGIVPATADNWEYGPLPQPLLIQAQAQIREHSGNQKLPILDRVQIEKERDD